MIDTSRKLIGQRRAPAITVLLSLALITPLVYYAESRHIAYYSAYRYLYVIPIAIAALQYGLAVGYSVSLLCTSLFLPILAQIVASEGASSTAIELTAMLVILNVLAYLVGYVAGPLRQQKELYQTLSRLSEHLDLELQLQDLLEAILTQVLAVMPAKGGEIVLVDEKTNQPYIAARHGPPLPTTEAHQGLSLAQWILNTRRSFLSNNVSTAPLLVRDTTPATSAWPRSLLAVPLRRGRETFGLICLMDRQDGLFREDDLRLLEEIAGKSEAGIENARLYHDMELSELRYRTLFEAASDSIFLIDARTGDIADANLRAERLTGYSRQELIGQSIIELSTRQQLAPFLKTLKKASEAEEVVPEETGALRKDGQTRSVEATSRGITLGGKPFHLVIVRDITRRKELEKQLLQVEKLSALGQLVSGVAHELNNPLTSIMGYAQLALESEQPLQTRSDLERILEEAERSARIVKNLLTFARQHRPEKRLADVNQVIESVLNLQTYQLRVNNIIVTTDLDENLPPILLDSYQIQQVLFNIITNAHQAMAGFRGSGYLHISSQLARSGEVVWITIRDDGPGILPENIDHIFDPFFTTKDVGEGTGLGLSICFGIMKEHGGDIWVETEVGQGTTFFIELPVQPAMEEKIDLETPAVVPRIPGQCKRILVVDDERHILTLINRILTKEGCIVETASNGEAAADKLAEKHWDLVISDVKMPGMDGRRLYAHVLATQPDLAERIIFTTGDTARESTLAFLAELGRPYLKKPFLATTVRRIVAQALKD
ncbi:MAG: ATP-binding protein [Chloroflexota bacterium]|nr:ATP-binding protein [Chloroflexota bacterium]